MTSRVEVESKSFCKCDFVGDDNRCIATGVVGGVEESIDVAGRILPLDPQRV